MMELDVHLSRGGDETWGFRLIGGVDFGMPLTVVKVSPNSPAEKAGLQNGDIVLRINDAIADDMSHDDSRKAVAVATDYLPLGVIRGLYDPVLDDQEPIFEPIDQDDFDQPSRPTEVQFELKDFTDIPQLNELPEFLETRKLSESRSLTASPFVVPTKPYRPFSTEPLAEIPVLEDPIILNPDYNDVFSKLGIDEDFLPKTRFKLPVSEQYDPDGTRQRNKDGSNKEVENEEVALALQEVNTEVSKVDIGLQVNTEVNKEEIRLQQTKTEIIEEKMTKEEVKFMERMKHEIDLERIELTAKSIVDESIIKAVTVAEEINKEIDVELLDSSITNQSETIDSHLKQESVALISEIIESNIQKEAKVKSKAISSEANELVDIIEKTTEEIVKQKEVNVAKEVENYELISKQQQSNEEKRLSTKQEIEEIIETGSVKNKTKAFDKEAEIMSTVVKKDVQRKYVEEYKTKEAKNQRDVNEKVTETQTADNMHSSAKSDDTKNSRETKMSTSRLLAEQRAYTIGLQTIPHIKGTIHSSYHYDLLLKTFFIHLTDVMVALSRFILTEPVLSKARTREENENLTTEQIVTKTISVNEKMKEKDDIRAEVFENKSKQQNIKKHVIISKDESVVKDTNEDHRIKEKFAQDLAVEDEEKLILSGSKMAQLSEKKSMELTNKMDAVITEFQTKAGIEETPEIRDRRSRSRSKIEEEVMKESDPLVWLEKVDSKKKSEEITVVENSNEFSSSVLESLEMKKVETRQECGEVKSKSGDGKTTYIAIVESHVYTNKDAILSENVAETSETSSVQSAVETNTISKAEETVNIEKVALKSLQIKQEVKKDFVEDSQESSTIKCAENATVQVVENAAQESHNIVNEIKTFNEEKIAVEIDSKNDKAKKDEIIVQKIIEPVIEVKKIQSEISETAVKEQSIAVAISNKQQESAAKQERTEMTVAKRPTTLELNIDEDPHIVKKKFEVQQERNERSSIVAKEEVIEAKTSTHDEDPHIVKKKFEVQESSIDATKIESIATTVNEDSNNLENDEFTALKVREEVKEELQAVKLAEETQVYLSKQSLVAESNSYQSFTSKTQDSIECQQISQEATFVAKSFETTEKKSQELFLNTDLAQEKQLQTQTSLQSDDIDTPTPTTAPTPLTDEYVFKLQIALPKGITPVPPDPSPVAENEDLLITNKNLIPHIDTNIEQGIIYDPPLPTPPGSKVTSPVYTKPGLRGGADRRENSKEEILEIERKSSLLTSAIDQTIRSIEEYKEEVGINKKHKTTTNDNNGVVYNGYAKVVETKIFNNTETPKDKMTEEWSDVQQQVLNNNTDVIELSKNGVKKSNTTSEVHSNLIDMKSKTIIVTENPEINTVIPQTVDVAENEEPIEGYRPVQFNVEEIQNALQSLRSAYLSSNSQESTLKQVARQMYKSETGEALGTIQGIVDGLEEAMVDDVIAKELGKPGITEEKIAELISGEAEMLREAHVMGLSRVLTSHMHRSNDDSSVDFQKIKPIVESLKDSEVLKALNEELIRTQEERKKKEDKSWTKFLQKPARPVPRVKFGYHGYVDVEEEVKAPYKVKIVKQPKPKVAPDYKPEDFNTGLLPWEERALREPTPPPVEAEDPILIPEEAPEILEAVDPLPESEVPDLEDSGIPLPPPKPEEEEPQPETLQEENTAEKELDVEAILEETEKIVEENSTEEMDQSRIAEQLMASVQNMVDPNASLEQQLAQMRAQLAALAQLPCVIQQSLELVTRQLCQLSQIDTQAVSRAEVTEVNEETEAITENYCETEEVIEDIQQAVEENTTEEITVETMEEVKQTIENEVLERMRKEGAEMVDEQNRIEKQKKDLMEQMKQEQESRQLKQRPTPRVGKPRPAFGPITPQERPLVLPGGRKWRKPQDAYNEQFIAETLAAQVELIQGKTKGLSYESVLLPYDERINFMKYEKPPVSLDHLKDSDVYKMIHNMELTTGKGVEMRTPAVAEADYREKCRSVTPSTQRIAIEEQVQP